MSDNNKNIFKNKRDNFTIINNYFLKDKNLTFKAKGLLAYIMSLPDDWSISVNDLKTRSVDGKDSVSSGMKELIKHRYCIRNIERNPDGTIIRHYYIVFDEPQGIDQESENPIVEVEQESDLQLHEKPLVDNPPILNTNNIQNTNKNKYPTTLFENSETNLTKKTLFRNSIYFDFEFLKNKMLEDKVNRDIFLKIDLYFYYENVLNWSDKANKMRNARGWLATIKDFIRSDHRNNKLVFIQENKVSDEKGRLDYLNNNF